VTQDELQLVFDFYLAKMGGMAGVVEPGYLPAAHRLARRGWLSRRVENDELVFELTNEGLTALALDGVINVEGRQN
jgi:hypothetical protein